MYKNKNDNNDLQLVFAEQEDSAVVLTNNAKLSLYKKSQKSGISTDILEEVYRRGYSIWNESFGDSAEQFAFDRVNSFVSQGFAWHLDEDLAKSCWKGYEAIGTKKKNGKTVPNCVPVKEDNDRQEKQSKNPTKSSSRFDATDSLVDIYKSSTPGEVIKRVVREAVAAWQRKEGKNPEGGLNKKGIESYRRENPGSKLSLAVTTKPSKLKPGSKSAKRRKSFCARMSGMKKKLTSSKTANDPDSRINKSLRKWNCE